MKPGRPKSRIRGKYVTWEENGRLYFHELDNKGNLVLNKNKIGYHVHHTRSVDEFKTGATSSLVINESIKEPTPIVLQPKVSEIIFNSSKTQKIEAMNPTPISSEIDVFSVFSDFFFDGLNEAQQDDNLFSEDPFGSYFNS